MADIRIKDLATTATTTASDDFMAVDGVTNGTRKLSAATPAFLTSVTTPSLTSPAATNLTLGLGTGGTALTLASSTLAATFAGTLTTAGDITAGDNTHLGRLNVNDSTGGLGEVLIFANVLKMSARTAGGSLGFRVNGDNSTVLDIASTGDVSISSTTAGSSGAGALVVQGGISAGNTGAASYFGGAATFAGAVTVSGGSALVQSGTADPFIHIKVTTDNAYNPYLHLEGYNRSFYVGVRDTGVDGLFSIASTSNLLSPLFSISAASPFTATFAGAVSITGNIGFYGQAATAKPTGVLVTAAAIHAALVTLNLIAA